MGTTVERIRAICKEKKIAISTLERDLGYGNGYLNPQKSKTIKAERLVEIAEYLGVTVNYLLGTEKEKAPTETGERVITDEELKFALWGGDAKDVTDEMFEEVKRFAEFVRNRKKE